MEEFTTEKAVEYFAMQTGHWEAFVEGFKEKREIEFELLSQVDYASISKDPKDYWMKMGKLIAYQQVYSDLKEIKPILDQNIQKEIADSAK